MPNQEIPPESLPKVTYRHGGGTRQPTLCTNGQLDRNDPDGFDVRASDCAQPRASDLMRSLLRQLEERGFAAENRGKGYQRQTLAVRDGVGVAVVVRERTRQVRTGSDHWGSKVAYVPIGELRITVSREYSSPDRTWEDHRKSGKLEEQLLSVVAGVEETWSRAVQMLRDRAAREQCVREAEQAAREEAARREEQERRREELLATARRWRDAELLRAFATAAEAVLASEAPIQPGDERERWLAWVRREADEIDPLVR